MIVHLCAAVCAKNKAGKGIGFACGVNTVFGSFCLLRELPCLFIHDRFMRVFKDEPVFRGVLNPLVLIRFLRTAEIDGVPHVFRPGKNGFHRFAVPVIRAGFVYPVLKVSASMLGVIIAWGFYFFGSQHSGDVIGAMSLHCKAENSPHDSRRFLVDQPVILVFRVFLVPVDRVVGRRLSRIPLNLISSGNLSRLIAQIPFVHDIKEGSKFVAALILIIHVVCDGDKVDTVLAEKDLGVKAGL